MFRKFVNLKLKKVTYKQIQSCYKKHFHRSIKTCWIADVKRQLGHLVRNAHNRKTATIINKCPGHLINQVKQIINGQKTCP